MQFYGLSTADDTAIYNHIFFSYGYGGEINAYNITTGANSLAVHSKRSRL